MTSIRNVCVHIRTHPFIRNTFRKVSIYCQKGKVKRFATLRQLSILCLRHTEEVVIVHAPHSFHCIFAFIVTFHFVTKATHDIASPSKIHITIG